MVRGGFSTLLVRLFSYFC